MEIDGAETFQQQALEISPLGDDFDPSKQPQCGEEYLRHMLYERKHCPAVVVNRPKKLEKLIKNNSFALEENELASTDSLPDANLLPTIEWKNIQSGNFMRTRSKIMMVRQHLADDNYDNSLEPPMITDPLAWFNFCQQHQPLLSLILRLNQRTLEQLLAMLGDWLKGERKGDSTNSLVVEPVTSSTSAATASLTVLDLGCSDQWLGDWLYAVLACLQLPIEPDVHSTLRDIARTCIELRIRLESHEFQKAIPYNLFIFLIGKIFDQLDLLENFKKESLEKFYFWVRPKQQVTCPGVWLCSHGYLEVTIKVLGYFFRTGAIEPYFPLLCHDLFQMEGYFKNAESMAHLINNLSKERLEITLWQNSRRLAYYKGVLMDLLHYTEPMLQCPHTNTRQLLMKSTPSFPGIIAPKVEITSEFFIKDKILNIFNSSEDLRKRTIILRSRQGNAKPLQSVKTSKYQRPCNVQTARSEDSKDMRHRTRKQKTVCHTRDLKHPINKLLNASLYTIPQGRRVSISSYSSIDNTHTSVGICDIEHDSHQEKFYEHDREQMCELCRLYKEVFLI